jgi:hypothetical protein
MIWEKGLPGTSWGWSITHLVPTECKEAMQEHNLLLFIIIIDIAQFQGLQKDYLKTA